MTDDIGVDEKLTETVDRFPFGMVLTTTFLQGVLFLVLNGPLISLALEAKTFLNSQALLHDGVLQKWLAISQLPGSVLSVSLFLVLSFTVGLLLMPLDRLLPIVVIELVGRIINFARRRMHRARLNFFTSLEFAKPDYVPFLSWLMARRTLKLHWEWELFLYHAAWNLFLNVAVFIFLALFLLWEHILFWEVMVYLAISLPFGGFALTRCLIMARTHSYYTAQFAKEQSLT